MRISVVNHPSKRVPSVTFYSSLLAAILLLGSFVSCAAKVSHAVRRDAKRKIEEMESRWRDAQLTGDVPEMDKLLSDDYFGISMAGQANTKGQQLDRMRNRTLTLSRIDLRDVKIKLIGSTAIVTSRAVVEGMNDGVPMRGSFRYTRVYQKRAAGRWEITNFEATQVVRSHDPEEQRSGDAAP